jgi:hypothetical protein
VDGGMGISAGLSLKQLGELQKFCSDQQILICLNGPNSQSLIEEIGKAMRQHIATQTEDSKAMDVFSIYIEISQNIRNYALQKNYDSVTSSATVIIASHPQGRYSVSAANLVEPNDGQRLLERIQSLSQYDKAGLKQLYKSQLREGELNSGGAGLGLIEMARRSSAPLEASLEDRPGGKAFFALRVIV